MARTTVKTYTLDEIKDAFAALLENGAVAAPASKGRRSKAVEEEPEEDEDLDEEDEEEGDVDVPTAEEVEGMKIGELRQMAVALGFDEQKLKSGILEEYAEKYGDAEEGDDEDEDLEEEDFEDEEEGDEEDEDEEEGYSREELEEMGLPELKEILRANKIKIPRGADQETLIGLILDEEEEEDEDEEEESDEEETTLSEDDLKAMDLAQLRELAKQMEIKVRVPKTATTTAKKKKVFLDAILSTADEEE